MPKAKKTLTTTTAGNPDTAIFAMIKRYDAMFNRLGKFCESIVLERCAEHEALANEAEQLAIRIIATPAHTKAALDAKWRIARYEGFERDITLDRMTVHDNARIAARRRRPARTLLADHAEASV